MSAVTCCRDCPRDCRVDRTLQSGFCGGGAEARVAKTVAPFTYEEPCLGAVGAVFFSGCSLRCSYCQNIKISRSAVGKEYGDGALANLFDGIAYPIDLVTPTHFLSAIERAVPLCKSAHSFIYNTSGYETADGVRRAAQFCDVFLTDFKYADETLAARLSSAPDYPRRAVEALVEMRKTADEWADEKNGSGGRLKRGLIVRHLVLPGCVKNSIAALDMIKSAVGNDVIISLMSQFTPNGAGEPDVKLKKIEYKVVAEHAIKLGFSAGYFQEFSSAESAYTPEFSE